MPRRRTAALVVAGLCFASLVVSGVLALAVRPVTARDEAVLHAFMAIDLDAIEAASHVLVGLVDPLPYALLGAALAGVALARGRPRRAAAVAALILMSGVTSQLGQRTLPQPRLAWIDPENLSSAAWPSGHATAAMTLALCAVLVAPPALRVLTALLGGAFALAVGYAILVIDWHFPSDVLAGYLLAGLWTALAVAALTRFEPSRPPRGPAPRADATTALGVASLAAVAGALIIAAGPADVAGFALERPAFLAGALVIAALAGALPAAVAKTA